MIKAFLSHSSQDKQNYVEQLAIQLGKEKIVYDEYSFEEGADTLKEIIDGLEKSHIFVILLSNNSLESEWVKKEITHAKELHDVAVLKQIYPIIIDRDISHNDHRIPSWLKDNYNLKPIMRPTVAARRINARLREISWSLHPELKLRNTIFVGRNDSFEQFEERIHDFDREKPVSIIVSGLSGVGRRTFLHNALCKVNLSKPSQKPSPLLLDRNVSIEDFILKLNDLGLTDLGNKTKRLSDKSVAEKVAIIHEVMHAARELNELIYLIDDGCLVTYERKLSSWFVKIIEEYTEAPKPIFCIASRYRVNFRLRPKNDKFYFVELSELNDKERKRLLSQLLDLYQIDIDRQTFIDVAELLFGFPDQIMYAVDLLRDSGSRNEKLPLIAEFNTDKASILLRKYESNEETLDLIRLLAQFEVISADFIFSIVPAEKYYPIVEELASEHVIELIGLDGEILRLNDMVRDYIKRNRLTLREDLEKAVREQVETIIKTDDIFEIESSEFIFSLKEALKTHQNIDTQHLIPSHYLRCMKDLYYSKGSLDRIIELGEIILAKEASLDTRIVQDIRYYLCLALARKKDKRLLQEVQNIHGNEHTFLLGFYYRLIGRLNEAKIKFEEILDEPYINGRVKREIVQVYVQLEEYEKALVYAKKNYEENRGNQFHAQAYFNCLINNDEPLKYKTELENTLEDLRSIDSEQAREMASTAHALFTAKIENDKEKAISQIRDCADSYPNNHYPLLGMCDIAIKYDDVELLGEGCNRLSKLIEKKHLSSRTYNRYKAYQLAYQGKLDEAILMITPDLKNYPQESKDTTLNRLKEISHRLG